MKVRFGWGRDTLATIRDTVQGRINSSGDYRLVAVLATKRLLVVWDRCKDAPRSFDDVGQPCAGYECDGFNNCCVDCTQSHEDYWQTMREAQG